MSGQVVCAVADVPTGTMKAVDIDGRRVIVANVGGNLKVILDRCPHQGAPLAKGTLGGTTMVQDDCITWARVGEVLRCPWHGWEFDMVTGRSLTDQLCRVHLFDFHIEDEKVVLDGGS